MSSVGLGLEKEMKWQVGENTGWRLREVSEVLTVSFPGERLGKNRSCGQVGRHQGDQQRKASFKGAADREASL